MTEAPAIRPRKPAIRTKASVSQVATSRSLEVDFKAPIASVATGRHSASNTVVTALCIGLPLGIARLGPGVAKTEVDGGGREVLSKIDAGWLIAGKGCQYRLEVGRLKFRDHGEGTCGTGRL